MKENPTIRHLAVRFLAAACVFLGVLCLAEVPLPHETEASKVLARPTNAQLELQEMAFGLFVHWSPCVYQGSDNDLGKTPVDAINPDRFRCRPAGRPPCGLSRCSCPCPYGDLWPETDASSLLTVRHPDGRLTGVVLGAITFNDSAASQPDVEFEISGTGQPARITPITSPKGFRWSGAGNRLAPEYSASAW